MEFDIGPFDPATRTVPVTFTQGGVTHQRPVNAVLGDDGAYDAEATADRVEEVAAGVAHKIDAGVIANAPPPLPAPEPEPTPASRSPRRARRPA